MYWEYQFPHGMVGIDRRDLLDIDEAEFKVEHSNKKIGKVVRELQCDEVRRYNRDEKSNLLLCIGGDENDPILFHEMWEREVTTLFRFYSFVEESLEHLATHHPSHCFVFMMDNLNAQIRNAGHGLVYRAPYWSLDGAVEYVFNTIHTKLQRRHHQINDLDALKNGMNIIIGEFTSFKKYFVHVGSPNY